MRGKGIEIKKRYNWCVQPNGRITILDVPIFTSFSRARMVMSPKGKMENRTEKVGERELVETVANMKKDAARGHYLPLFEGHQEDYNSKNAQGLGFLDNFVLRGGVIFSDFTEITAATFARIKDIELPYRSVEYATQDRRVIGVALLATRDPYFKFPMLAVKEKPVKLNASVTKFSTRRSKLNILKFLNNDEKNEDVVDAPVEDIAPQDMEDGAESMNAKLDQMIELMANLGNTIQLLADKLEAPEDASEEASEEAPEEVPEEAPEEDEKFSAMTRAIKLLATKMDVFEGERETSTFTTQLQQMCDLNPQINFTAIDAQMRKFTSAKDKKEFLDFVQTNAQTFYRSGGSSLLHELSSANTQEQILSKFVNETQAVQSVAREALKDYQDTIKKGKPSHVLKFQKQWGTDADYVKHWVALERDVPGNYAELMQDN